MKKPQLNQRVQIVGQKSGFAGRSGRVVGLDDRYLIATVNIGDKEPIRISYRHLKTVPVNGPIQRKFTEGLGG